MSLAAVAAGQFLILIPPLVMAVMLTSAPAKTLRLAWPEPKYIALAVVMVVALNPLANELRRLVEYLFPVSDMIKELLGSLMEHAPSLWVSVVVFALIPAVCEEVAFRGFILSGLEHRRRTRSAIFISALLFGFLHVLLSLFQQLFNATLLGVFLGLLAIRSRSLLPGIIFHMLNNGFVVASGSWIGGLRQAGLVDWIYRNPDEGLYHEVWVGVGVAVAVVLFHYLWKYDSPSHRARRAEAASAN